MRKKKEPPCFNIITNAYLDMMGHCCGVAELGNFPTRKNSMIVPGRSYYNSTTFQYEKNPDTPATPATLRDVRRKLSQFKCILATTIPAQVDAAQALQAVGFKKVTTTPSREDSRRTISLWMWQQKPVRRKRNG